MVWPLLCQGGHTPPWRLVHPLRCQEVSGWPWPHEQPLVYSMSMRALSNPSHKGDSLPAGTSQVASPARNEALQFVHMPCMRIPIAEPVRRSISRTHMLRGPNNAPTVATLHMFFLKYRTLWVRQTSCMLLMHMVQEFKDTGMGMLKAFQGPPFTVAKKPS